MPCHFADVSQAQHTYASYPDTLRKMKETRTHVISLLCRRNIWVKNTRLLIVQQPPRGWLRTGQHATFGAQLFSPEAFFFFVVRLKNLFVFCYLPWAIFLFLGPYPFPRLSKKKNILWHLLLFTVRRLLFFIRHLFLFAVPEKNGAFLLWPLAFFSILFFYSPYVRVVDFVLWGTY